MTLTAQPLAKIKELDAVRADLEMNVPTAERIASLAAGAALVTYGLSRRSFGGVLVALAGVALGRRGVIGYCPLYQRAGINSGKLNPEAGVPGNKGIKVVQSIAVDLPPAEVYRYWRALENLPRFMEHIESVEEIDALHSRWVVRGPAGTHLQWTAKIIADHQNEMISWESLPGAEVLNAGSVWFEPLGDGSRTNVRVSLQYQPPAGILGAAVAKMFGEEPGQQLSEDLARFKAALEESGAPARWKKRTVSTTA